MPENLRNQFYVDQKDIARPELSPVADSVNRPNRPTQSSINLAQASSFPIFYFAPERPESSNQYYVLIHAELTCADDVPKAIHSFTQDVIAQVSVGEGKDTNDQSVR